VSTVNAYKHQWTVVEAVAALRAAGVRVRLDLVGGAEPRAKKRLDATMAHWDPEGRFVTYHRHIPFDAVHELYHNAELFIFASSCENLPNILLEAMAAGLPIACSDKGPMPEVLGDAGLYFDPEDRSSLTATLETLLRNPKRRALLGQTARTRAEAYCWQRCTRETFGFLREVMKSAGGTDGPRRRSLALHPLSQKGGYE
jgi:glycosyltransferase involved in cell wall biosynthesis